MNGFLTAVHIAYTHHVPLCISPDHIWTLIVQGFCTHMDINHEALRKQFVNFDGKKELVVRVDHFSKGNPENDWPSVFS